MAYHHSEDGVSSYTGGYHPTNPGYHHTNPGYHNTFNGFLHVYNGYHNTYLGISMLSYGISSSILIIFDERFLLTTRIQGGVCQVPIVLCFGVTALQIFGNLVENRQKLCLGKSDT